MTRFRAQKSEMRDAAKASRAAAARTSPAAGDALVETALKSVPVPANAVVAGYFPIRDEIDVRPLLNRLRAGGRQIALPRVIGAETALSFALWGGGEAELADGPHGTRQPAPDAVAAEPDVVILPLLAFDRCGYRLGYGGGYYDRTLADLRQGGPVMAVGAAYAAQEVASVPHDEHDQRLDWVITEREAIRTGKDF